MAIFDPPQNPNTLTDHQKFGTGMITAPMAVPNLVQIISPWGASGETGEIFVQGCKMAMWGLQ